MVAERGLSIDSNRPRFQLDTTLGPTRDHWSLNSDSSQM
jgi:hypothetical protein